MEKRGLIFGTYSTADWLWTLTGWSFSAPEYQEKFLDVPGRDGALDLSAALTAGAPTYHSRTLTAKLEYSEGNRLNREAAINIMVNWLDGWRHDIVLPDDPDHYITGRVSVAKEYNDNAHAAVTVTAVCDPWRYAKEETVYTLTAETTEKTAQLANAGRRTAVPLLVITGGTILLKYGAYSWALGDGTYQLPDLTLPQGGGTLLYSGTGTLRITYREAVL
jgi:phage-related protein